MASATKTTKKARKTVARKAKKKVVKKAGKKAAKKAKAVVNKTSRSRPGAEKAAKKTKAAGRKAPKASAGQKTKAKKKSDGPDRSAPALAEVDADVLEFIAAIDRFKQMHGRPFPSWSEVLLVVRELGYKRD